MDITSEKQNLLNQIIAHAEPGHQMGMSTTLPTELKIHGVRVPHLREIARTWHYAHRKIAHEELIPLVEALLEGESREERLLAIYLLGHHKRWIPDLTWAQFDRWRRGIDNWEVGDGLAQWVLAPWLSANPDARLDHLRDLIADEDVWSRRLALVATTPINRNVSLAIPDLTLELVEQVKEDRDATITKAVSWALRELTKTHPERVSAYLEENGDALPSHIVREVSNKLKTGLKSGKLEE